MMNVFFFKDTATTEIYTLSLHDVLPISEDLGAEPVLVFLPAAEQAVQQQGTADQQAGRQQREGQDDGPPVHVLQPLQDRKSTRLNSSHANISYAVFCLKKTKTLNTYITI